MLSVQSVDKRFTPEGPLVLEELDLRVGQGEFVSLLGPSGCGKTTLLKIVAGLLPPTGGTVLLEGKESLGPSREKAMVFQHFNLLPWRTAITNVAYGLEVQGMPKAERLEKAAQYLQLLDLEGFENHYPSQISGGMKQRVGAGQGPGHRAPADADGRAVRSAGRAHQRISPGRVGPDRRFPRASPCCS